MCGRYAFFLAPDKLRQRFGIENLLNFPARYNCAPMQSLPIVVKNRLGFGRWGFCPSWKLQDDPGFAAKLINARSETISEKPSFRDDWAKGRRCIVPANGFYEWKKEESTGVNQPYFIAPPQDEVIGFAGVWSKIGDLVTFTVLTKEAQGAVAGIHHRTPVILKPEDAARWFAANTQEAMEMVENSSSRDMVFHKVHTDVGRVANDEARLVERLAS